ncbi:hypothetical protein [Bosea sp. ANAM02]|uniref:hypothetical protein n=1 Tax=Bosea sp. ANAM02 TaxID=2020412 RepID=UPI0015638BE5|nr:hypothetical protein [Bosea sp. ANAM02]
MNKRIVSLPAAYRAQVIPPRHRNPHPAMFRENVTVAIPELTSIEARLGVEWIQNSLKTRYNVEGPAPRIVSRFHDGRHYGAVLQGDGTPLRVEDFLSDIERPKHSNGAIGERRWRRSDYPAVPGLDVRARFYRDNALSLETILEAGKFGRIASSNREEDLAAGQAALAKGLIFVDDCVWSTETADEMWWGVHRSAEAIELMVGYRQEMLSYCSPFRLDRWDEAHTFATRVAEQSGLPLRQTEDQVIIHTPASIVRDDLVMLAEQITAGAGLSVTNGQRGWPEEVSEARHGLLQLRSTGKGDRDRSWAGQVIQYAATLRVGLLSVADHDGLASDTLRGIDLGMLRWELMEKGRHADIEAVMVSEADLAALSL